MDCDRSALLKKAIKATARLFENEHGLAVAFFAFLAISNYWILMIVSLSLNILFIFIRIMTAPYLCFIVIV